MYSSSGFIFQDFLFSSLLNREFKVPSTRIRIFLNPQLFLSGFTLKFPRPHASSTQDSSAIKCLQSMRHRMRHSGGRFVRCAAILVYCSVRDWTRFRNFIGLENIWIHPSTRHRIRCGIIFPLWRADFSCVGICRRSACTNTRRSNETPENYEYRTNLSRGRLLNEQNEMRKRICMLLGIESNEPYVTSRTKGGQCAATAAGNRSLLPPVHQL